jgi:hypothetical protein
MNIMNIIKDILPKEKDYLIGYANLDGLLPVKYKSYGYAIVCSTIG